MLSDLTFWEAVDIAKHVWADKMLIGFFYNQRQGMGSHTYIGNFKNGESAILQLRAPNRRIAIDVVDAARCFLGDFVPTCNFLGAFPQKEGQSWLAYEMTCLQGVDLALFMMGWPSYNPGTMLPRIARGLGTLLGKCSSGAFPGSADIDSTLLEEQKSAICRNVQNPKFAPYKKEMEDLLDNWHILRQLSLAFTNDDVHYGNIIVTDGGEIAGLVDWEFGTKRPMGYDLGIIHQLRGSWDQDNSRYNERSNCQEIEDNFWSNWLANVRVTVDEGMLEKVEMCMRIKACSVYGELGLDDMYPIGQLRMELHYRIPRRFLQQ